MKKLILTVLLCVAAMAGEIKPFVGIAMNSLTSSVKSESPLGLFGVKYETQYTSLYYRHISSIPQIDETQGINEVGVNLKYKYKFIEPYIGASYNNELGTSAYYTKQISKWSAIAGVNIKYKDKDIFIEYRDTGKGDMLMYGVIFNFDSDDLEW